MADSVEDALAEVIEGRDVRTLAEARPYLQRGDPATLARQALRIEPGQRLPMKGTAERRLYESEKRQYQRYTTEAGEQRGKTRPSRATVRRIVALARARQREGALAAIRRGGLRLRVHAYLEVSEGTVNDRPQWIPGGREASGYLDVGAAAGQRVADAWAMGLREDAADAALSGMFDAVQPSGRRYWPGQTASVIDEVDEALAELDA